LSIDRGAATRGAEAAPVPTPGAILLSRASRGATNGACLESPGAAWAIDPARSGVEATGIGAL